MGLLCLQPMLEELMMAYCVHIFSNIGLKMTASNKHETCLFSEFVRNPIRYSIPSSLRNGMIRCVLAAA